jgi:DUF4097 and DUF4098 domain-containing protein YvlB
MRFATLGFAVATAAWLTTGRSSTHLRSAAAGGRQGDRWSWHGRIAAGKTVEIRGINGDVTAEAATGAEVEVSATKHGRRSDPDEVRIEVIEHEGGVTICAVYPGDNNRCAAGGGRMNTRNNDVEVDFTVRVPRGVGFDGNTVNGDVEASDLSGDVDVNTVNGSVRLETAGGEASGTSVNGSVTAVLHAIGQQPMRFHSVNGAVNVTLPASISADVDARTVNGSIDTDFPITVNGRMSPRHIAGTIGQGGRRLELETVNGSIRLRKLP